MTNSVMERMADRISWRSGRYIKIDANITSRQIDDGQKNADCIFVFRRSEDPKQATGYRLRSSSRKPRGS